MSKKDRNNGPTQKESGGSIAATKSADTDVSGRPIIREQLLPGIPDDVTLRLITTKLSWGDLQSISGTSPRWRQALHSREIYDARVRSGSTETLVILDHSHSPDNEVDVHSLKGKTHAISVYSIRDGTFYPLPPIPGLRRGIPASCGWASLDGKFYVLGGAEEPTLHIASNKVYRLDLAGEMKWKRCANMLGRRLSFGAGVLDGKIYAIGGVSCRLPAYESEVYDPKVNAWSQIEMKSAGSVLQGRLNHHVTPVGEELFVWSGDLFASNIDLSAIKRDDPLYGRKCTGDKCYCTDDDRFSDWFESAHGISIQAYHPGNNEWRWIKPEEMEGLEHGSVIFTAEGKLHSLGQKGICVHGTIDHQSKATPRPSLFHTWDGNLSVPLYSNAKILMGDDVVGEFFAAIAAGGDLLGTANWYCNSGDKQGSCLLRGKGFRSDEKEIYWEFASCCLGSLEASPSFGHNASAIWPFGCTSPIMCTIQL